MKIAISPGSFDPITNGHLDLIERAIKIFDKIIVAVAKNPRKKTLFTLEERMYMLEESLKELDDIEIDAFEGLLVNFARSKDAHFIVRGLRVISDFEFEFQMALMNRKLAKDIETVFLMTSRRYSYLSSSMVKEVASLGGCISDLVPKVVESELKRKFSQIAEYQEA